MPSYSYLAIDEAGREEKGIVKAASGEDARASLARRRLAIVAVSEEAPKPVSDLPWWNRPIRLSSDQLNQKQLTLFTRQLATISRVSPMEEALRTISRQSEQDHVRAIVRDVADGVVEGRRLADALARAPKSFPPLYRAMVAAGESSGALPQLLSRLADLLERQSEMRGKVNSALAYPIVLMVVAIGVVAALMIAVVPRVVEQFDDVGQQLPLLTRIVIAISSFMASYWWVMLILLGLSGLALWQGLKQPAFRLKFDGWLLRLPLIGRLLRDLHAARLARTLATMIESRLPLIEGLRLTAATVHNRALRGAMDEMVEMIRQGGSLSAAMTKADIFPPLLVYLAASGESAGQLDVMLAQAADYLEREFDNFTSTALSMLEPLIIIVMGGIVATIILSILLPILQLQSLIGA